MQSGNDVLAHSVFPEIFTNSPDTNRDDLRRKHVDAANRALKRMFDKALVVADSKSLPIPPRALRLTVGGESALGIQFPMGEDVRFALPVRDAKGAWRYLLFARAPGDGEGRIDEYKPDLTRERVGSWTDESVGAFLRAGEKILGRSVILEETLDDPPAIVLQGEIVGPRRDWVGLVVWGALFLAVFAVYAFVQFQ